MIRRQWSITKYYLIYVLASAVTVLILSLLASHFAAHRLIHYRSEEMRNGFIESHRRLIKQEVEQAAAIIEFHNENHHETAEVRFGREIVKVYTLVDRLYRDFGPKTGMIDSKRFADLLGLLAAVSTENTGFIVLSSEETAADRKIPSHLPKAVSSYIADNLPTWNARIIPAGPVRVANEEGEIYLFSVRPFLPLSCYICGYKNLDEYKREIQRQVMKDLEQIRFGDGNKLFGGTLEGDLLFGPLQEGGIRPRGDLFPKTAAEGGGFLEYRVQERSKPASDRRIGYIREIPEWGWYIGAGFSPSDIEPQIEAEIEKVRSRVFKGFISGLSLLFLFFFAVSFIFRWIRKKISDDFIRLTDFISTALENPENLPVEKMKLREFQNLTESVRKMVTLREQVEIELHETSRKLQTLLDNSPDNINVVDRQGAIIYTNRFVSVTPEEAPGTHISRFLVPEDKPKFARTIETVFASRQAKEIELRAHDGLWWLSRFVPLGEDNGSERIMIISTDITERKNAQKLFERNLHEKETLLKEIHHRVKNNLQIISSILNLQLDYVTDEEDKRLLIDSKNRVKSMALVHEQLYEGNNYAGVSAGEYVYELVGKIAESFRDREKHISVEYVIDDICMDIDTIIPFGLIVTEIVSNSYKYAFREREAGIIRISLKKTGDTIQAVFEDDGSGIELEVAENPESDTLGMKLIVTLISQLEGTYTLETRPGVRWKIEFKERRKKSS